VIYQRALGIEMRLAGLEFSIEMEMPIFYREFVHLAQAMNYLEAYKIEIGLLLNFGAKSLEFKRVHNNKLIKESLNQENQGSDT